MKHTALALICLVLVCAGCSQSRKAADRRAVRAAGILARAELRAARLCPDGVFRDTVRTVADTAMVPLRFSDRLQVDSLLADCDQLREALTAERALYAAQLGGADQRVVELPRATKHAVERIRTQLASFEPLVYDSKAVRVTVRHGDAGPLLQVEEKSMALPCPPHVGKPVIVERVVTVGVARWYRTFTWCVLALVVIGVVLILAISIRAVRSGLPMVLLLLTGTVSAQDWTRTTTSRTYGVRQFVLNGTFTGSDTALVQVYHDGLELHSEPHARTFSLTLGEHDQYWVKFTDGKGRVKRIALHELSDDMVEFYPPIEVDFERAGNLVLIKQSTGKPDWQEFDVGLSRKRKAQ